MDECNDVVMIRDNIGRSSSTDSATSQVGAGSRSHDLGDASVMSLTHNISFKTIREHEPVFVYVFIKCIGDMMILCV